MRFASRCERSALMTREATFLVQAFNDFKGVRLNHSPPVVCKSADGARRTAKRLSLSHTGVVAYSITLDSETEDYDDQPTIFYRASRLPVEFDSMP
jgi:hypothetical protein